MIKLLHCDDVYDPAEDSYLLLEAVKFAHGDVLDMCAGSGIIGLNAAEKAKKVILADTNTKALSLIKKTARLNGIKNVSVVKSDLFRNIKGKFDVIYCNPPYLPGHPEDTAEKALYGGKTGYEVTIQFIKGLRRHLKEGGQAFLVLSTVYDIEKVYKSLKSIGFSFNELGNKSFFFEELRLICIYENRRGSLR